MRLVEEARGLHARAAELHDQTLPVRARAGGCRLEIEEARAWLEAIKAKLRR